jgi:alkaline phosphatase D
LSHTLSRRALLAGLALAGVGRCPPGARAVTRGARFPLGVASGDPRPDGATLWTRYTGSRPLQAVIWRADDGDLASARFVTATPADGGFTHVEARGLPPDTWHHFSFVEGGAKLARSAVGRFRTAPAPGARPLVRFGATSCTCQGISFSVLARASERNNLDAFLLLGDTVYCDGARTLGEFRARWHDAFSTPEYQALKASTAVIATWDDHEFFNDWSEDVIAPPQFAAASRAWFEHLPVPRNDEAPARIWRSLRFGDTAEVFVLDSRSERYRSRSQYVSPEQLDWLKQGLLRSTATFKLVMTSVPISSFESIWFRASKADRWESFPEDRERILRHVEDEQIRGVLWVAGDFHLASAGRVSASGPGKDAIEVLVGPGAQLPNAAPFYPSAPQFDWSSGTNNFAELELDPRSGEARIAWVDRHGNAFHRAAYRLT